MYSISLLCVMSTIPFNNHGKITVITAFFCFTLIHNIYTKDNMYLFKTKIPFYDNLAHTSVEWHLCLCQPPPFHQSHFVPEQTAHIHLCVALLLHFPSISLLVHCALERPIHHHDPSACCFLLSPNQHCHLTMAVVCVTLLRPRLPLF